MLDNDLDPDGPAGLSVTATGTPTLGSVTIELDGTLSYTPNADVSGVDTFSYTISDGSQTSTANVTVTIAAVPDTPVATDQIVVPSVAHGTARTIALTATDVDSASLTFAIATPPSEGVLGTLGTPVCTAVGAGVSCSVDVTYTANSAGSGPDSFTFTANDGGLTSDPGTVTLNVLGPIEVNAGGDTSGVEGSAVSLAGAVAPEAGATVTWSAIGGLGVDAGAGCTFGDIHALSTTITCDDDGAWDVTLTADDPGPDDPVADTLVLNVANADPTVAIDQPTAATIVTTGASMAFAATVGDAGTHDVLSCTIDWGDGTSGSLVLAAGSCTGSHTYASAGSDRSWSPSPTTTAAATPRRSRSPSPRSTTPRRSPRAPTRRSTRTPAPRRSPAGRRRSAPARPNESGQTVDFVVSNEQQRACSAPARRSARAAR